MKRYRIQFEALVEVRDELAVREEAFRTTARHMQDPNLIGISAGGLDPREQAATDLSTAITTIVSDRARLEETGLFVYQAGCSASPLVEEDNEQ